MKAQRLPSGSWRVRTCVAGVRRSFTAPTKREAEMLAAQYIARGDLEQKNGPTVGQAVAAYIDGRAGVLSPSTLKAYRALQRTAFGSMEKKRVSALTSADLQAFVSEYAATHTPKSVRNAYGLLVSSLRVVRPDLRVSVRLPQPVRPNVHTPAEGDVAALLDHVAERDPVLFAAVLLGAFGPLRRGEVCALTGADVDRIAGTVTVRRNMVAGPGNVWTVKQPKTAAGYRVIQFPPEVMARLPEAGPEDRLVPITPGALSKRFKRAAAACGLPDVHFHGLRHFGASVLHSWGVPDVYILKRGGWSSDYVMKRVYRDALTDTAARIAGQINADISTRFFPSGS